jgi:predicted nucleic acid-binding Zn ribbon protein
MTAERQEGPRKIGDLIGQIFVRRGLGELSALRELEEAWRTVAGESIARRSRVGAFRRGTLEILVDNAVLLQELSGFHKQRLLAGMQANARHSRISALRFRRS